MILSIRRPAAADAATAAIETSMFRVVGLLRIIVTAYALAQFLIRGIHASGGRWHNLTHPAVAGIMAGAMVAWTAYAVWRSAHPSRRTNTFLAIDLGLAVLALAASPEVLQQPTDATVPGFWVMCPVLAWAVHWNRVGGLVAATAVAGTSIGSRDQVTAQTWSNIFLLILGGFVVGACADALKRLTTARDRANQELAEIKERAALARVVHDGVLQVLALVQRQAGAEGGAWADIGRLAGDQEQALRALVQRGQTRTAGTRDLAASLASLGSTEITVVVPGLPVMLASDVVDELAAVVGECLANVARHAPDAQTWVTLEQSPGAITVGVRDDGPGIAPGRLDAARAAGRLGVAESIRGRVAALGGDAVLLTAVGAGTEWEFRIPVSPVR